MLCQEDDKKLDFYYMLKSIYICTKKVSGLKDYMPAYETV